jgi:hypothetical protein
MLRSLITLLFLFNVSASDLDQIVDQYYAQKSFTKSTKHECEPPRDREGCFKLACNNVDRFECDDMDEIGNITRACRGIWNTKCMSFTMSKIHKFDYDRNEEMVNLINTCKGVYDMDCAEYVCQKLGKFSCDDLEELADVYKTCIGQR